MQVPISDSITLEDKLGRLELLKDVVEDIRKSETPRVIGIHGDWGAGKSSFLWQLEFALARKSLRDCSGPEQSAGEKIFDAVNLSSEPKLPVVWFEAWKHQHDEVPLVSLLHSIREQFSPGRKIWDFIKDESKVAVEVALTSIDEISRQIGVKVDPKLIREVGDRYEKERMAVPPITTSLSKLLDEAIGTILKGFKPAWKSGPGGKRRFVVLIDDLDRCEPQSARKLLEGLKVFLGLKNCVFVIAMDEAVVEEFFMNPDGKAGSAHDPRAAREDRRKARQYLEKIVQTIYRIPFAVEPSALLRDYLLITAEDEFATQMETLLKKNDAIPPNPRKIKMLANVLQRFRQGVDRQTGKTPFSRDQVVATAYLLAYLYQFEPRLYRLVDHHKEFLNEELLTPCRDPQSLRTHLDEHIVLGIDPTGKPIYSDPIISVHFWPWKLASLIQQVPDEVRRDLLI